jgi:hypothetical protein
MGGLGVKLLPRRESISVLFRSAVRSPYNKRTMEAGLWGIWVFRPNAKSISYVLSM